MNAHSWKNKKNLGLSRVDSGRTERDVSDDTIKI